MKLLKRVVAFVLLSPLIAIFGPIAVAEMVTRKLGEGLLRFSEAMDAAQRTDTFNGWIAWARKIAKLD